MTTAARIGRVALAALVLGLATASPAVAADFVVAAPEAASLTDKVTDEAGVLSDSEKAELEDKIAALQQEHHVVIFVVFASSLPEGAESYADSIVKSKGPNSAAYAVGVDDSTVGVQTGNDWPRGRLDVMYEAAYAKLADGRQFGASALALVDDEGVILGAVHRPAMGYTWFGGRDHATSLDGKDVAKLTDSPADKLCLSTYLHPTSMTDPKIAAAWEKVAPHFATVRMLGAGSVDLSCVADGTWGAWMQHSVKDWDWYPGQALVLAAGGAARKVEAGGVEWCIAGNKQVVDQMEEWLRG